MSIDYLVEAVRDHLRATLEFPGGADGKHYCDIQPEGRPPATIGDYYLGIDEGSVVSGEKTHLKELFEIHVAITKTIGQTVHGRYAEMYLTHGRALRPLERKVIKAIHGIHELRQRANSLANAPSLAGGDIFQQPLWYMGRSATQCVGGDWAGLEPDKRQFLVRTLRFGGAIRTQALDVMQ